MTWGDEGASHAPLALDFAQVGPDAPTFTKYASNPIFEAADATPDSIYWPCVVDVRGKIADPIDNFYKFTSTDHDAGTGGIYLATGPTWVGPWTDQGLVYRDTTVGTQTETPTVIWNPVTELWHLYYHNDGAGNNQSTCLATSATLEFGSFTRVGVVIDVPNLTDYPGQGHTGYARVHRLGNLWVAYHLMGGDDYSPSGMSMSADGITWQVDPRPLGPNTDLTGDIDQKMTWTQANLVEWRGRLWIITTQTNFVSGAEAATSKVVMAPMAPTLRRPLSKPTTIIEAEEAWESTNVRAVFAAVLEGRLCVYYQMADKIGVAVAEVA